MTTPTKPQNGMRVSIAEFLELDLPEPDDKRKMELDDGKLYIMPRPRPAHQSVQGAVFYHFESYFRRFDQRPGEAFTDVNVALPSELPRLFAPDVTIVLADSGAIAGDRTIEGVPDIVVEILSMDRNRDLVRKRQVYAEAGIPEYWILDQVGGDARLLEHRDGEYVERAALTVADSMSTPLLPGLEIPLADIFRHRGPPRPNEA